MPHPKMRDRPAGLAAVEQLLRVRDDEPARTNLDRFFGLAALGPESRPWYTGALGEIAVGKALSTLPEPWAVFHALPVGTRGSDIDHLVVGPSGLFTINTKAHRRAKIWVADRAIMVNGQRKPYIRNSEHEAARVAKLLRAAGIDPQLVRPVIALYDPASITWRGRPENVTVVESRGLVRWLKKGPVTLSDNQVAKVAALVDEPRTWAPVESDSAAMERFEALQTEVDQADLRRMLWVGLVAVAAGVTGWVILSGIAGSVVH